MTTPNQSTEPAPAAPCVAGRDLDILIAKRVMALKPCTFTVQGIFSGWATMWGCQHPDSRGCYPSNQDAVDHPHSVLAHYSTDIKAAWSIVERATDYDAFTIGVDRDENGRRLSHHFGLWFGPRGRDTARYGMARASSVPLAICLAALNAIGGGGERK